LSVLTALRSMYQSSVLYLHGFLFLFFFSSRRRHTRCYRDWSSDVCSSDLQPRGGLVQNEHVGIVKNRLRQTHALPVTFRKLAQRSEERRVGKECRSRWSQ